jgi:hypothetical protein
MMKWTVYAFVLASSLLLPISGAQAQIGAGGPEYVGEFAAHNPVGGQYTALEHVAPTAVTRLRGLGFGGAETHKDIPGAASPVRFKSGEAIEFVVRVASQSADPLSYIHFFALDVGKDHRTLHVYRVSTFGFSSRRTSQLQAIAFTAAKMGPDYFRLTLVQPLPAGEYLWDSDGIPGGYCFGVDP